MQVAAPPWLLATSTLRLSMGKFWTRRRQRSICESAVGLRAAGPMPRVGRFVLYETDDQESADSRRLAGPRISATASPVGCVTESESDGSCCDRLGTIHP